MEFFKDKCLLLIEDNDEFIQNAVSLFNIFVKETFVAKNSAEALDSFNKESIDFIISDIHLKNESGLDLIKKIREKNNNIPIMILSGHKDEKLLFEAMTLNLSGYLLKPINYESLIEALNKCKLKMISNNEPIIYFDGIEYHRELKKIIINDNEFELNKKEVLFFEMLCENRSRIITKEMFLKFVYEYESMSDNALNNFILRTRKRFDKKIIQTIPNIGYKIIA